VSLTRDENGRRVVGVHIADVSHYVRIGGAIDREAALRGTSTYLPGRTIHMLPEGLSQNLCSLVAGADRLAMSVLVTLNSRGEPVGAEIFRSVIRSRAKLSYEQVQATLDGGIGNVAADDEASVDPSNPADESAGMLIEIEGIAKDLNRQRVEAGALDFDMPEAKIDVDDEGHVTGIRKRERLMSHRLIEELMLLANRTVAHELAKRRYGLLYRVHAGPDAAKLNDVATLAAAVGYPFSTSGKPPSVRDLQRLIDMVAGKPIAPVLEVLIIRSLPKAVYQPGNIGHFGLAAEEYTHFTSPIRRYPDLVVHRQLVRMLAGGDSAYDADELASLGTNTSESEQAAAEAERDAIKAKQVEYLAGHIGEHLRGTISGVKRFGLFVALNDSLCDGMVPAEDLPGDSYRYEPASLSLTGRRTGRSYRFGDPVVVLVARADIESRQVDFVLVDAPKSARRAGSGTRTPSPERLRGAPKDGRPRKRGRRARTGSPKGGAKRGGRRR